MVAQARALISCILLLQYLHMQMFLVAAAKLLAFSSRCCIHLPGMQMARIVAYASRYARTLTIRRARSAGYTCVRHMYLTKRACTYLSLKATYDVLLRKQSRCKAAVSALHSVLRNTGAMRRQARRLQRVVHKKQSRFIERLIF